MKMRFAQSLTRKQVAEVGRELRDNGYDVKTRDLDSYGINIVNHAGGADPDARREVESIIDNVTRRDY